MPLKKPYIVSNWKMNGTRAFVADALPIWAKAAEHVNWVFCPPTILISSTKHSFPSISIGGQDCSAFPSGAFTSQISATQLAEAGASYVIVGHSECRQYMGQTSEDIALKAQAAHNAGITPIICIGEPLDIFESNETIPYLKHQLDATLSAATGEFLLAYEPIWAIGTGKTATPGDIAHVHNFLREQLPTTPLLYGGSVGASNAKEILQTNNVDGVLVGGASLKISDFTGILEAGSSLKGI